MIKNKTVVGIVDDRWKAEEAVLLLQRAGFEPANISVLLPDDRGRNDLGYEAHTKAPEGAIAGAGGGGVIGGAIGLLAGVGALAIPGLGPFIAAGPLLAALSGAAAGATLGGVTGALIGLGLPELEAKSYEGKLQGGSILLAVHVRERAEEAQAREILEHAGAHDVSSTRNAAAPRTSGRAPAMPRELGRSDSQF